MTLHHQRTRMTQSLASIRTKRPFKSLLEPYLYLGPGMSLILLVTLVPLLIGISYSFQHLVVYDTFNTGFVGLENYRLMLGDQLFWNALWNTLRWTMVSLFFQVTLGLGLALLLRAPFAGRGVYQALVFLPLGGARFSQRVDLEMVVRPENGTALAVVVATGHHPRAVKHSR
jgi:multiple sugar transport system permease protein